MKLHIHLPSSYEFMQRGHAAGPQLGPMPHTCMCFLVATGFVLVTHIPVHTRRSPWPDPGLEVPARLPSAAHHISRVVCPHGISISESLSVRPISAYVGIVTNRMLPC